MNDPATCTALVLFSGNDSAGESSSTPTTALAESSGRNGGQGESSSSKGGGPISSPVPKFVGLSNQGATCYMNSLLQTLYMTPEVVNESDERLCLTKFRAALYEWKHEPPPPPLEGVGKEMGGDGDAGSRVMDVQAEAVEDPSECIPLQLQRLFGQLQLSDRSCVETRALTNSFGWTTQDSFQQHDVQELCRVLFDALESTFQGTVNEKLVNNLYQGSLRDYVTCKECQSESSRLDNFLDISLVLRPFGSNETMKSVTESLEYFLKPEVLDGDNQYFCQACDKKVDAVKGLKFERLPYLLSLQLKRFDFDYSTFQRIKLNDEMRFPLVLDMNKYVDSPVTGEDMSGSGSCRGHQRSDFQRSVSLEKKQLQGLLGKIDGGGMTSLGDGNSMERYGAGVKGEVEDVGEMEGEDDAAAAETAIAVAEAVVDPDTDETDKEEGSLDSGASTEAKVGDADLPELEDYWGLPFQDKAGMEGGKSNAFDCNGEPRGGVDGKETGKYGAGKGVAWVNGPTVEDDPLVPEENAGDPLELLQENGPWVYELFAVLIHSGSALGGHYYAHIKSLGDNGGWFTFNDSRVTPTDEEAVKRAWGGRWGQSSTWQRRCVVSSGTGVSTQGAGVGSSSSSQSSAEPTTHKWGNSAANAYMLMYRRVDPPVNKRHLRREEVPEHVVREVRDEDRRVAEAEATAEAARVAQASTIHVKVKLNGGLEEKTVKGDKRRPIRELADRAAEAFGVPVFGEVLEEKGEPLIGAELVMESVSDGGDSGGGETDRETQDEGRSDVSAVGRGGVGAGTVAGASAITNDPDHVSNEISDGREGLEIVGYGAAASGSSIAPAEALSKAGSPSVQRLVRLREYICAARLPGIPLEEESSPADLFFTSSNKTLWLETREPGFPWPRFDRDDINVEVVRFERVRGFEDSLEVAMCREDRVVGNGEEERAVGRILTEALPAKVPLPPRVFPVVGKFAPKRNTRMKPSGTVREVRAQLAQFAGTVEERTRVFTMESDRPESTYKVLCPPRFSRQRLVGIPPPVNGYGGVCHEGAGEKSVGDRDDDAAFPREPKTICNNSSSSPFPLSTEAGSADEQVETKDAAPMIGFTTAKELVEAEARKAVTVAETICIEGIEGEIDGAYCEGDEGSSLAGHAVEEPDIEDEMVVLGKRGANFVHKVFVEEVPEEEMEDDGGENISLAVQAALDEPNRISLKLLLTEDLEGPEKIRADKRWTLNHLRDAVAAALGRGNRSFRLRKTNASAPEIRPGSATLSSQGFSNLLTLHVSPGRPLERYEDAITVAPLDVGFSVGIGTAPPLSVREALAAGKASNAFSSTTATRNGREIKVDSSVDIGVWQSSGRVAKVLSEGGREEECSNDIGEEGIRLSGLPGSDASDVEADTKGSTATMTNSICSGSGSGLTKIDTSSGGGGGGVASGVLDGVTVQLSGSPVDVVGGEDDEESAVASDLLQTLDFSITKNNEGSGDREAGVSSISSSVSPPMLAPVPPLHATAVWAAAAATAAAAASLAAAETERLTTTMVEVLPAEGHWGEQFTMAVKRSGTIADIRRAVWEEMRRRRVIADPVDGPLEGPSMALTPAALRLREKLAKLPSTILRDLEGKPARFEYGPKETPWILVAQQLPFEEDLGPKIVGGFGASGGNGGKNRKGNDFGLTVNTTTEACRESRGGASDYPGWDDTTLPGVPVPLPPADTTIVVVVIQWWNRWEWRLTEKYEAWINPKETIGAARKRLAEQVGVNPANLRANRCISTTRLRLCDLRGPVSTTRTTGGTGGGLGLGTASVESGGWDSNFSSVSSPTVCRWGDLEITRGDQPVGVAAFTEGELLLLQDISQPLKRLAASTEASISGSVKRGGGERFPASSEGCDLSSVGSWYGGSETDGVGGAVTSTVLPANKSSSTMSYSFKPKERALRIRTRRDRLQEVNRTAAATAAATAVVVVAASAAATAVTASAVAAVAEAEQFSQGAAAKPLERGSNSINVSGSTNTDGGGGSASSDMLSGVALVGSGVDTEPVLVMSSCGEERTAAMGTDGVECQDQRGDDGDNGGSTPVDCTRDDKLVAGECVAVAVSTENVAGSSVEDSDKSRNREEGNDVWEVESSEREAYAGLSGGNGDYDSIVMHSAEEVAERGGRAQFDDLSLV